jgi:ElaB/YqjD/DUF883 family membrane-anchored ribosome-binding protein
MQRHVNGRSAMEKASEFLANTREFTKEHASQAKSFIHEKPLLSTLLGLGAGLMVGLLFSRRVPKIELVVRSRGKAS